MVLNSREESFVSQIWEKKRRTVEKPNISFLGFRSLFDEAKKRALDQDQDPQTIFEELEDRLDITLRKSENEGILNEIIPIVGIELPPEVESEIEKRVRRELREAERERQRLLREVAELRQRKLPEAPPPAPPPPTNNIDELRKQIETLREELKKLREQAPPRLPEEEALSPEFVRSVRESTDTELIRQIVNFRDPILRRTFLRGLPEAEIPGRQRFIEAVLRERGVDVEEEVEKILRRLEEERRVPPPRVPPPVVVPAAPIVTPDLKAVRRHIKDIVALVLSATGRDVTELSDEEVNRILEQLRPSWPLQTRSFEQFMESVPNWREQLPFL